MAGNLSSVSWMIFLGMIHVIPQMSAALFSLACNRPMCIYLVNTNKYLEGASIFITVMYFIIIPEMYTFQGV